MTERKIKHKDALVRGKGAHNRLRRTVDMAIQPAHKEKAPDAQVLLKEIREHERYLKLARRSGGITRISKPRFR